MRDRTKELGNQAEGSDEDESSIMIKPGSASAKEEKENEAFFKKVHEIREALELLRSKVSDLENKQKTMLVIPLPEEGMKRELQTLRDEIKTLGSQVQKKLKTIESKEKHEEKYVPINIRMQKSQHGVLSRQFVELMDHCHAIQSHYRERNMERIQRQLKITGNNVTENQLEAMIESGQTDVFTHNILSDSQATVSALNKDALNEIESRKDEILKLERSIRDLHEMFQYLAYEVEQQGEVVNRIETNIMQSHDYVEKAVEQTGKAVEYQRKAGKKKLWIALCCAILLLILAISLAVTFS